MSSPGKQSWQNPKDIMKTHRIKRRSSLAKAALAKSKSATSLDTRTKSSSFQPTDQGQRLASSHIETSSSELLKRKNPFICEISSLQSTAKRRSIFDDISTASHDDQINVDISNSASVLTGKTTAEESHKLLRVLQEADLLAENEGLLASKQSQSIHAKEENKKGSPIPPKISIIKSFSDSEINCGAQKPTDGEILQNVQWKEDPPTDWSLKTKMRIVVDNREESFGRIPGIDAKNVTNYVQHTLEHGEDWKQLDLHQRLRRCFFHYSYPQLPWLRTFPRLDRDFKSRSTSIFPDNEDIRKAVQSDWAKVFTSLYQQLRGGICPYFYACTHQFTVLFRCQRSSPHQASMSALLSPSTRGLRDLFSKDDIEFRLPNVNMHKIKRPNQSDDMSQATCRGDVSDNKGQTVSSEEAKGSRGEDVCENNYEDIEEDDEEEDEEDINDHHGASKWLEGMGLDKKNFPSLEPLKVKIQRDGYREIDNRPQSMVYVEGGDVHAFFNFLLNYPACIASSGPQHGLPPTLLSPVPFVGGALAQNTVKHSNLRDGPVRLPGSEHPTYSHVFEISGPILPHHTLNAAAVLREHHKTEEKGTPSPVCSSTVTFNTHVPSAALNTETVNSADKDSLAANLQKLFVNFELSASGLLSSVKERLVIPPSLPCGGYVREMKVSSHGFEWTV